MRRRLTLFSTLLSIALIISACGGGSDATPTTVSAQEVFDAASQRFQDVNSLHFELQLEGNVALGDGGLIRLRGAEGDLLRPDRAQATADVSFGGANLSITLISIGEEQFITNFLTGRWESAPADLGFNPAVLFDDERGIPAILRQVQSPQLLGSETVSGIRTHHLSGTVSQSALESITGGAVQGDNVEFEVWIGQETPDIHKLQLESPDTSGGTNPTTWTLLISKHNSSVTIERPNV